MLEGLEEESNLAGEDDIHAGLSSNQKDFQRSSIAAQINRR